jgi:hypothetical protein
MARVGHKATIASPIGMVLVSRGRYVSETEMLEGHTQTHILRIEIAYIAYSLY